MFNSHMQRKRYRRSERQTAKGQRREETRSKLIAAAKRLFSEHGYDHVSVTEIAREAGVTHSMINVYFGGKAGLLYQIVRENNAPQYDESLAISKGKTPALLRLSNMLRLWIEKDTSDPRLLAIMQSYSWVWPSETEQENAADRARFKALIEDLLQQAQEVGEVEKKIDPQLASQAIFAIYTWGLRGAVFQNQSTDVCHKHILDQVSQLLAKRLDV